MKLTKKEHKLRFCSKELKRGKMWFYLNDLDMILCSFHDARHEPQRNIDGIPVATILRALQERGYLRQWDQKTKRLRKLER